MLKIIFLLITMKNIMKKILNLRKLIIFAKGYTPNWSEEVFIVKKIKYTVPWTYEISDLNGEKF